jgi:hypothetical protein
MFVPLPSPTLQWRCLQRSPPLRWACACAKEARPVKAPGPEPSAPPEACPTSSATSRPQRVAIDGWNCRMGHGMPWDVMGCHGIIFFFCGSWTGECFTCQEEDEIEAEADSRRLSLCRVVILWYRTQFAYWKSITNILRSSAAAGKSK